MEGERLSSAEVSLDLVVSKQLPSYVNDHILGSKLGENQVYALKKKYLLRDDRGRIIETPAEAVYRMASTMASVELGYGTSQERVDQLTKEFYHMIEESRFSPAGRIWTNAGTSVRGLFNCYVLPVHDSIDRTEEGSIFNSVADAAVIHKNGGGTGYNFSELRPRGTYVKSSKGVASGPVSFIGQFDKETEIINSGNRRGANMGILDINHPDIIDFITAKAKRGKITNFNVSAGIYDDFMKAVESDGFYALEFPKGRPFTARALDDLVRNIEENKVGGSEVGKLPEPASIRLGSKEIVPGQTTVIDSYSGRVAGRVDENGNVQLSARYVMNLIAELAHKTADPGMVFLDAINRDNPLPNKGPIRATNPCGEQPLHPYDACNLGSIILPRMIKIGQDGRKIVDRENLESTVVSATRFMDNVNDANKGPIPQIEKTVLRHRRIGMGVMGWADMLIEMGIPYDSKEAVALAEEVMGLITDTSKSASVGLAQEKGVFPDFEGSVYDDGNSANRVRNVQRTTIAPTGTISMVYDVSSGIEPIFAIAYRKNIRGGDSLFYFNQSFKREAEKRGLELDKIGPLIEQNHGSIQGIREVPEDMQRVFRTAHDISYDWHIAVQAAFQRRTDNAVSKTINMGNEATIEEVKNAYMLAWKSGLKGITVYRDGCKDVQVLETGHGKNNKADLESRVGTIEKPLRVPNIIPSIKVKQQTPWGNMHVSIGLDPSRGYIPIETFGNLGNAGGVEAADIEALGRLSSLYLRSGGSVDRVIDQLRGISSGVSVSTRDGGIYSLPMAFARALEKVEVAREMGMIEDLLLGKIDSDELDRKISDRLRQENGDSSINGKKKKQYVGEKCPDCGSSLATEEGCKKCHMCGYSKC